jgi:hypothetical protein
MPTAPGRTCHGGVRLMLNGVMHALILTSILTAVFVLLVSKVERAAMKGEVDAATRGPLRAALAAQRAANPAQFCHDMEVLSTVPLGGDRSVLDVMHAAYDRPSPEIVVQNEWVRRTAFALVGVLVLVLLVVWGAATAAGTCPMMWELLAENAITFVFIGAIEAAFFLKIASKFVPVKPSYMQNEIVAQLQAVFNAPAAPA